MPSGFDRQYRRKLRILELTHLCFTYQFSFNTEPTHRTRFRTKIRVGIALSSTERVWRWYFHSHIITQHQENSTYKSRLWYTTNTSASHNSQTITNTAPEIAAHGTHVCPLSDLCLYFVCLLSVLCRSFVGGCARQAPTGEARSAQACHRARGGQAAVHGLTGTFPGRSGTPSVAQFICSRTIVKRPQYFQMPILYYICVGRR
jgi:hypothetical protein